MTLFQAMFALRDASPLPFELPGLCLSLASVQSNMPQPSLRLDLWETPEGLKGILEFSLDQFDVDQIACAAKHFNHLLRGIMADPDLCLSDLLSSPFGNSEA